MNRSSTVCSLVVFALLQCLPFHAIAAQGHVYKKAEDVVAWVYRDFAFDAIMQPYWKNALLIEP